MNTTTSGIGKQLAIASRQVAIASRQSIMERKQSAIKRKQLRAKASPCWLHFFLWGVLLILALGTVTALAADPAMPAAGNSPSSPPVRVVASFSILGDMVKQIGGDKVSVENLVGPESNAHMYEPTPAAVRALTQAQLLVMNGLNFEPWINKLIRTSKFKGIKVVASSGVQPRDFTSNEMSHCAEDNSSCRSVKRKSLRETNSARIDPHAWQSLVNGALYACNIGVALQKADPTHASFYASQTDAYVKKILDLDTRVKQFFATLPLERRRAVISHDAFGYLGQAYGVTFISTMGLSSAAEASAGDVARIVAQIRKEKVPAVFLENVSNSRLEQQIARETGAKLGGTLYSDALAKPDLPPSTYLGMMEWNLAVFKAALKP